MPKHKILFVDDEEHFVRPLPPRPCGEYEIFSASSGANALNIMAEQTFEILVSNQRMPNMTGLALLSAARDLSPSTLRILLTGYADLVAIIGDVKPGDVFRFLNDPWRQDEIEAVVADAAEFSPMEKRLAIGPPLTEAVARIAPDGIAGDRYEAIEMFTGDGRIMGANTVREAAELVERHDVDVVVASAITAGDSIVDMLAEFRSANPFITLVTITHWGENRMLVRLIENASIYRFAMATLAPNIFRIAISAAMHEYRGWIGAQHMPFESIRAGSEAGRLMDGIVHSLARFTKVW